MFVCFKFIFNLNCRTRELHSAFSSDLTLVSFPSPSLPLPIALPSSPVFLFFPLPDPCSLPSLSAWIPLGISEKASVCPHTLLCMDHDHLLPASLCEASGCTQTGRTPQLHLSILIASDQEVVGGQESILNQNMQGRTLSLVLLLITTKQGIEALQSSNSLLGTPSRHPSSSFPIVTREGLKYDTVINKPPQTNTRTFTSLRAQPQNAQLKLR